MKLAAIILLALIFTVAIHCLFNIIPNRAKKTKFAVLSMVLSLILMYVEVFLLFKLGEVWNIVEPTKKIISISASLLLIVELILSQLKKD